MSDDFRPEGPFVGRMQYAPTREDKNLAGIPDALIFFCFFSCIKARKEAKESVIYPIERAYHTHLIVKRATFWCPYVGAYPNTPYRYPIRGKRKTFDN